MREWGREEGEGKEREGEIGGGGGDMGREGDEGEIERVRRRGGIFYLSIIFYLLEEEGKEREGRVVGERQREQIKEGRR